MDVKKKTALAVGAGVLMVGAGIGVASLAQAEETATPKPASTTTPATSHPDRGSGRDGHGPGAGLAEELAEKLGVDESTVKTALANARKTLTPSDGTTDRAARDAALAKALAEELKVDQAKVAAALEEIRADAQAEGKSGLSTRLAEAVKAGTLTQAEADAVMKAAEAGIISYGRGGR